MEKIKKNILESSAYARFSGENEKMISDLINNIKSIINEIESSSSNYESQLNELFSFIEINNAVLSHFKNNNGLELILKLKAVIEKYRLNVIDNSILLNTAEHLLSRLDNFQKTLFNTVDTTAATETQEEVETKNIKKTEPENIRYKWTTFERNKSLFITEFKNIEIADYDVLIKSDRNIHIFDLMKSPDGQYITPRKIIIINSGEKYFAADRTGREIQASRDIITPIIYPFENSGDVYSGRVRLFGKNYLVIRNV